MTYYAAPPGPRDAARRREAQLHSYLNAASRTVDRHPYPGLAEGPGPFPLAEVYVRQLAEDQHFSEDRDRSNADSPDVASLPAPAEAIFAGGGRIRVVLAAAGGGKSVLLRRYLATEAGFWMADGRIDRADPAIPVLIRATALAGMPLLAQGLAQAAIEELGPYGLRETPTSEFFGEQPAPQVPWLVMVDGLDEIPDRATRVALLERLAREADQELSPYRFVVATRPLPAGELDRLGPGAERFELQPFSAADMWKYARGCFRDLPEVERQVSTFAAGLRQSGLNGLARTPLVAFMLCQLYAADPARPLPDGRAGAYQSFVELVYEQNTHKGIRRTHDEVTRALKDRHQIPRDQRAAEQAAHRVQEDLPQLIDHLAYERINGNTALAVDILASQLNVQRPEKVNPVLWNAFLGDLLRPTGLLAERSGDLDFLHQTLLEYHAARHATRDEQARAALLERLFQRRRDDVGHDLDQPSYLGFLLDGLLSPADDLAEATIRALEELAASDQRVAWELFVKQVRLRTKLPHDLTVCHLVALAHNPALSVNRLLAASTLAMVPGYQARGAALLVHFTQDSSLSVSDRVRAARLLAEVDGHRSQGTQLLVDLLADRSLDFWLRLDAGYHLAAVRERRDDVVRLFAPLVGAAKTPSRQVTHAALLAAFGEESAIALLLRLANDPTIGIRDRVDAGRALEVLTKALDVAVGDEAGGEAEEGLVDVVASFPSDP
ncbi:NACHT domain-containing protein [Streptomyces sp. NBC_01367]|uniref:NACHT domain-containing protein n=1 Tax=Streptomyces sp. NBC_01367 TaxID=2903841 RepID=UPI00324A92EE